MTSPTQITVSQLSRLVGLPDAPVLVDVCIDEDFADDPRLLPTAFRHPYQDIAALAPKLAGQRVVVICQKGRKLSQGAAAVLRNCGIAAESLEGGVFGWRDAELPMVPASALPVHDPEGRTVWVTRHRPKIDRISCPWLIRRFVDRNAQFLFVEPSEVQTVAEKFNATPFDVEDVFWSHRGDQCTFDTMIREFALETEPMKHLATIIRGADTNRHDLAPESAGLMAASLGLSRMYRDDLAQLDAGMALYDAFYRWVRDASNEGHDWPAATTGA
ncbi:sulfurtransferase/chromate resistance protein [uncultured Sneathiella sp.]|uniref:sulfurtransferase/chromate resistance protein n=2 Tax=uncultured Sneathiella sp. TaxID=879315 RepID=UPI0030D8FCB8